MATRTTLTLDDRIAAQLKRIANDTDRPYHLKPVSLGKPRAGYDLRKSLALADEIEDQEIARAGDAEMILDDANLLI